MTAPQPSKSGLIHAVATSGPSEAADLRAKAAELRAKAADLEATAAVLSAMSAIALTSDLGA